MTIEIIDKQPNVKGVIYSIKASGKILKVLFLFHAIERIKKWGITEETVAETLILPEEVMVGHRNRYIAHRRYGDHLVRAVYEYEGIMPVLVTVYFPYTERYFKGGGIYEDQILG
ncbi:MAG: DUF4258 domain-containing protein [Nitrospirae bacterium]|nr:DUF4258 domain-containing protein [Nitrospirota bacterium]